MKSCWTKLQVESLGACFALAAMVVANTALAADAENGRRLAQLQCATCHIVVPNHSNEVADSPPFEIIARKPDLGPGMLAFLLLDPHPRMNVTLTRREAMDIAAYIGTLVK